MALLYMYIYTDTHKEKEIKCVHVCMHMHVNIYVLEVELSMFHMLSTCFTTELQPPTCKSFWVSEGERMRADLEEESLLTQQ